MAAGGGGDYTVANVQARTGTDTFAGWSLFVVYELPSEPLRNVAVFDGFRVMTTSQQGHGSISQTISGFRTPPAGPVNSKAAIAAYEGEVTPSANDEGIRINGTALSDGLNPATDQINGSITQLGTRVTTKNPDQVAQIASLDLDLIQANGVLAPGSTSAQLELVASGADGWFAHALAFSTEVQQPLVKLTKSVSDVDGGDLRAGDVLEYRVTATNEGNDAADSVTITDPVPASTAVTPRSIDPGAPAGGSVVGNLGSIAAGASKTFVFRRRTSIWRRPATASTQPSRRPCLRSPSNPSASCRSRGVCRSRTSPAIGSLRSGAGRWCWPRASPTTRSTRCAWA